MATAFLDKVKKTICDNGMIKEGESVLAAVSGGADSICLLKTLIHLSSEFGIRVGVAHLNHMLRGKESDRDEEFVREFANELNVPFYSAQKDVSAFKARNKLSVEEAAREVRYAFLNEIRDKHGYDLIALGHNADDNAELILMNILRGSGSTGITGIPPVRGGIYIRPLISASRSEILDYISDSGLNYVEDSSNRDTTYLRNRIRLELLPLLKESYNPNISESLNRLGSILKEDQGWIENYAEKEFRGSVLKKAEGEIELGIEFIDNMQKGLKRRVLRLAVCEIKGNLRKISLRHIDNIIELIESGRDNFSLDLPGRLRVKRRGGVLKLKKEAGKLRNIKPDADLREEPFEYTLENPGALGRKIFIKEARCYIITELVSGTAVDELSRHNPDVAFFNPEALKFPLTVRNFRRGDRFTPGGMAGSQKLKKFFINNKIGRAERARIPVILSDNSIIWIAGYRVDNNFSIKNSVEKVLKIEVSLA